MAKGVFNSIIFCLALVACAPESSDFKYDLVGFVEDGKGHPRTSGTNAKILGKYVREEGIMTLMDALRRMTIEPARRLETYVPAMLTKGRLTIGADADITIFDAGTVIDRSNYTEPTLSPEGIPYVIVNGGLVVENSKLVPNVKLGQPIRAQRH